MGISVSQNRWTRASSIWLGRDAKWKKTNRNSQKQNPARVGKWLERDDPTRARLCGLGRDAGQFQKPPKIHRTRASQDSTRAGPSGLGRDGLERQTSSLAPWINSWIRSTSFKTLKTCTRGEEEHGEQNQGQKRPKTTKLTKIKKGKKNRKTKEKETKNHQSSIKIHRKTQSKVG